jgi:hypothetical protein
VVLAAFRFQDDHVEEYVIHEHCLRERVLRPIV